MLAQPNNSNWLNSTQHETIRAFWNNTAELTRHFKVTTKSRHNNPVAQEILSQRFTLPAANVARVADKKYIRTDEDWCRYSATVIDYTGENYSLEYESPGPAA